MVALCDHAMNIESKDWAFMLSIKKDTPSATCLFKDNKFWIYHSNLIENMEEEKANPSDKLWLVLRHMANDKDHQFIPGLGYKL